MEGFQFNFRWQSTVSRLRQRECVPTFVEFHRDRQRDFVARFGIFGSQYKPQQRGVCLALLGTLFVLKPYGDDVDGIRQCDLELKRWIVDRDALSLNLIIPIRAILAGQFTRDRDVRRIHVFRHAVALLPRHLPVELGDFDFEKRVDRRLGLAIGNKLRIDRIESCFRQRDPRATVERTRRAVNVEALGELHSDGERHFIARLGRGGSQRDRKLWLRGHCRGLETQQILKAIDLCRAW